MQEVTQQQLDDAKHVVEATLGEQFDDIDFVMGSVQPDIEEWDDDDEFIEIKAIYDGVAGQLRGERMVGVIPLLRRRLQESGITAFPIMRYIAKSDWDEHPYSSSRRGNRAT